MKTCVIEIQDNVVIGLSICQDTEQAKGIFKERAKGETELSPQEIDAALKDGVVTVGEGSICLFGGHEIPRFEEEDDEDGDQKEGGEEGT